MARDRDSATERANDAVARVRARGDEIRARRVQRPPYRANLRDDIRSALVCVLWALPIALTGADGAVRVLGFAYSGVWVLLLVPSAAAYLFLLIDSALLFRGRRPLVVPSLIHAHIAGLDESRPAVHRVYQWVGRFSADANPIGLFAGRLLSEAITWRADMMATLVVEATEAVDLERAQGTKPPYRWPISPEVEISQPLLRRMEPELACMC